MKVFISHSSTDKKFVRTLKDCLIENSINTWVDEDQLELGDSLLTKLEEALNESSHLVIVLSPNSVESEWVKYELKKALENNRTGLMQKIIPIKFRECVIPEELKDLLYADLSDMVVLPTPSDRLKFLSEGFDAFFLKLVRALKNSAKAINKEEKKEILSSIKSSEKQVNEYVKNIHRANYELIGFSSPETLRKYVKNIKREKKSLENEEVLPFLLPASLKNILNLKLGDVVQFEADLPFPSFGHFAGYRIDDLKIALDPHIRTELYLTNFQIYQVEINPEKKIIRFVNNSEFVKPPKFPTIGESDYALSA